MDEFIRTYWQPMADWLRLGQIGHSVARSSLLALGCFLIIAACDWRAGRDLSRYASRHFLVDLFYHLVLILYLAWLWDPIVAVVSRGFPALDLALLHRVPLWLSIPVYWLVLDFLGYWIHRMQHSRIWWRFHRVHHSQEHMTFASSFRNHPVDQLFALSVTLVPSLLLGVPAFTWVPYQFLLAFNGAIQHANLPWHFGPWRKLFVSPVFHAQHHSTNPSVHDRNFGGLFSFWDFLFGTAFDVERCPERTGVEGWQVPESFWAHLFSPFRRGSVATGRAEPPGAVR